MDHDVFISHSSKDLGLVETLCSKLETNGIHCWYSERNVPKGTFYPGKIVDAIAKSKVLLLIHSLDADHSHNVLTEIACAFEKQMPIIPYKTAAFEPCDDMKYFLRLYQAINVYSHTGDEAWSLLVNELQNSIQRIPEVVVPLPVGTPVADDQPRFIRLYVKDIRSGDLHLWIKSGRSGQENLISACNMLAIEQGVKILEHNEINPDLSVAMGDDFTVLVLAAGGRDALDRLKLIETEIIKAILNDPDLVEETSRGVCSVSLKTKITLDFEGGTETNPNDNNLRLVITPDPDSILVGGDQTLLTAQLYNGDVPQMRSGNTVVFSVIEDALASLPTIKSSDTNAVGQAITYLTSKDRPGVVSVVATGVVDGQSVQSTAKINLLEWGVISGIVLDKNSLGIPRATVKLWQCEYNPETDEYTPTRLLRTPENPQYTMDISFDSVGRYTFYRVPSGYYRITADKVDSSGQIHNFFTNIHLKKGTKCSCIVIPDYVQVMPVVSSKPR